MRELEYPFDSEYILKKSKKIKRELVALDEKRIVKKIAVLGGSTTHDVIRILELFLLNQGIEPLFYESEYGMFYQDAIFGNPELTAFSPDLIYIHTSNRNITNYPKMEDSKEVVLEKEEATFSYFKTMWETISSKYDCPVIQNNFELPFYRLLGNRDGVDIHGKVHFLNSLNRKFSEYAEEHENFFINDIMYLSSCYGLDKWSDPFYWHMYKYALCLEAIPSFAFNLSNIIKSIYGKNKKSLVLDLDNTLWGGIVGDDGVENLEIGQETSMGQVFSEFQNYVKEQKDIGIMLNINSKNEMENALAGLGHPDGSLKEDDFIIIKANWDPKSKNLNDIASELNILPESLVFIDDNPAEREIVRQQVEKATVPEVGNPETYIRIIDHSGFFEVTRLSEDDKNRNQMYQENVKRKQQEASFTDYKDYLMSLKMKAIIAPFTDLYMARIAQLTNKSNQFNLTTKRFTQTEIETIAKDENYITLYGKLEDQFGDNGVVSVVIGEKDGDTLHVRLWLMSCRVLKRDMEFAMMDSLVDECKKNGIREIKGYYYKTAKNAMVKDFFSWMDFEKIDENDEGDSQWFYVIPSDYKYKNEVIERG